MNKKLIVILLSLCGFNFSALAAVPSIVAIVDDKAITMHDLQERKKLYIVLNDIKNIDGNLDQQLNSAALTSLIDEELLLQHADKINSPITEGQVAEAINNIEKQNNFPTGSFAKKLTQNGLKVDSFKNQIKGEIIKMNIISGVSRSVSVNAKEVNEAILLVNAKDAAVEAKIFVAKEQGNHTLNQMNNLRKKLTNCHNIKADLYDKFADIKTIEQNISELDSSTRAVIKDLQANQTSHVYKNQDGHLQLILLCTVSLKDLNEQENEYITNIISNKKAGQKAKKFIDDLKKRAYIKILI